MYKKSNFSHNVFLFHVKKHTKALLNLKNYRSFLKYRQHAFGEKSTKLPSFQGFFLGWLARVRVGNAAERASIRKT